MFISALFIFTIFALFFNPLPTSADNEAPDGFKYYQIKKGDSLKKIAPPEHWDIICKVNRIDEFHFTTGKKIMIPVDLEKASKFKPVPEYLKGSENFEKCVYVFLDIQYFGAYEKGRLVFWGPISSGKKEGMTPKGIFKVLWKTKLYRSKKYDAEMPFAVNISDSGIFIHAQSLPGYPASHGCIRLLKSDAKKIFEWIKKDNIVILASNSIANFAMLFF